MTPPIDVKVNITGGEELFQKLTQKSERFAKKGLRLALRAGARVIWQEMKTTVSRGPHRWKGQQGKEDFGFIADHIGIKVSISAKQEQGKALVGPVRKGFWAMFLEFGTSKMAARPFIRPAYENTKESALQAFVSKLREIFNAEMGSK